MEGRGWLAPERYGRLQRGAHFELSLEGWIPRGRGGAFQEEVQGLVGVWQSWWMSGREGEGGGDGERQAEGGRE